MTKLDFEKLNGLIPTVAQDAQTGKVLMVAFMNEEAYNMTLESGKATFYSRSKQRLWVKGESSGNFLYIQEIIADCDNDTLLLKVNPEGPVCHTGKDTCFDEKNENHVSFISYLEKLIAQRKEDNPASSYTASLFAKGINKVAQKVGEEAVELVIEAKDDNRSLFVGEAADLLFHYLVLLEAKEIPLSEIVEELKNRHQNH